MTAEDQWKQNRNSSKAWLVVVLILFVGYGALNIFRIFKRKAGAEIHNNMPHPVFHAFLKVMEIEMMPVLIIYGLTIALGGFFVFACFLGYLLVIPIGILTFAYMKDPKNDILIMAGKGANAAFVFLCFMVIWIDDLEFTN